MSRIRTSQLFVRGSTLLGAGALVLGTTAACSGQGEAAPTPRPSTSSSSDYSTPSPRASHTAQPRPTPTDIPQATNSLKTALEKYAPKDGSHDLVKQQLTDLFGDDQNPSVVRRVDGFPNKWEVSSQNAPLYTVTLSEWAGKFTMIGPEGTPVVKAYDVKTNDGGQSLSAAVSDIYDAYCRHLNELSAG